MIPFVLWYFDLLYHRKLICFGYPVLAEHRNMANALCFCVYGGLCVADIAIHVRHYNNATSKLKPMLIGFHFAQRSHKSQQ